MPKEKLMERARDELFSHINRCGVLQAEDEDQKNWMDETIDYIGERYPDLSDADLKDLYAVGLRFCKPAVRRTAPTAAPEEAETGTETAAAVDAETVAPTDVETAAKPETAATTPPEAAAPAEAATPVTSAEPEAVAADEESSEEVAEGANAA